MNLEHEAKRYRQIASLERDLCRKLAEISGAKAHVKELVEEYNGLLLAMRAAARDEGDLPLFAELDEDEDAMVAQAHV